MSESLIPKDKITDMLDHRCNILSDSQMGKTNLAKILAVEMAKQIRCQVKVFDTAQVWRHSFLSSFKLQEINDTVRQVIDTDDHIIFDIEYMDSEQIMQFMGNTVMLDYERNRARKKATSDGKLGDWIFYFLEEAQNSLGNYSLNKTSGRMWLKAISEGANFDLGFAFIGQRAADISTKALERSQTYWIGRTTGDNNTRKLRGIIGSKTTDKKGEPLYEVAKKLERGEFIFWNGAEAWNFKCPKFEDLYPDQKPELVIPPEQRWSRIF